VNVIRGRITRGNVNFLSHSREAAGREGKKAVSLFEGV
jgi:hypothetical protein